MCFLIGSGNVCVSKIAPENLVRLHVCIGFWNYNTGFLATLGCSNIGNLVSQPLSNVGTLAVFGLVHALSACQAAGSRLWLRSCGNSMDRVSAARV